MPDKGLYEEISGADVVAAVRKFLGDPYVYGAAGPDSFDCSGLVQYTLGTKLSIKGVPRTSESQWAWGKLVSVAEKDLQQGDLVFSDWPGDGQSPGHVGIYSGHGKIIEASKPGTPVREIALNSYYKQHVKGYKRVKGVYGTADGSGGTGDSDSALGFGLAGIGKELANASKFVSLLLMPQTWVRVVAFAIGAGAVGAGVWMLAQEAGSHG